MRLRRRGSSPMKIKKLLQLLSFVSRNDLNYLNPRPSSSWLSELPCLSVTSRNLFWVCHWLIILVCVHAHMRHPSWLFSLLHSIWRQYTSQKHCRVSSSNITRSYNTKILTIILLTLALCGHLQCFAVHEFMLFSLVKLCMWITSNTCLCKVITKSLLGFSSYGLHIRD